MMSNRTMKAKTLVDMVTSKIEQLSEDDLNYLDKLLHKEFSRQCSNSTQWQSKNGYKDPTDRTATLRKLMEAVQSQKKILTMPKW
jgi:hypothetical protein